MATFFKYFKKSSDPSICILYPLVAQHFYSLDLENPGLNINKGVRTNEYHIEIFKISYY